MNPTTDQHLTLALSPAGHLHLETGDDVTETVDNATLQKIQSIWGDGYALGLLRLGLISLPATLPPSIAFWQEFARLFLNRICQNTDTLDPKNITPPTPDELNDFLEREPFMVGSEYLNSEVLVTLWLDIQEVFFKELARFHGNLPRYFASYHSAWNTVGRVCFNLAENKNNPDFPFAFLATYTTRLSKTAGAQHLPLGRALQEYAGEQNKALLIALLSPVQKAAQSSTFIKELVDSGRIFRPLAWKVSEAYRFLKEIQLFESAGIIVRVPNWWNRKHPNRPQVAITVGKNQAANVGINALLDFNMHLALPDGQILSAQEWQEILEAQGNLIQIKGQWVEVDREKLAAVLEHWQSVQHDAKAHGLSFAEGMRLLAGVSNEVVEDGKNISLQEWSSVVAGNWLQEKLTKLRNPTHTEESETAKILQKYLKASLRPYQVVGLNWLWLLYNLKLGGCLADDMGLGKTIQVLSLLLLTKHRSQKNPPNLIVVPASLLDNWQTEIKRFAPDLSYFVAHPAINEAVAKLDITKLAAFDVVFTTYSFLQRLSWLEKTTWDTIILDEAQMIKNPSTKQTRAAKTLQGKVRFILTGTPIENSLGDLWSLFDFIAPGLLSSQQAFKQYGKKLEEGETRNNFFAALRTLVKPYILRRLKSDKSIITDLPDKTELQAYCNLSKQQVALYQQTVQELTEQLQASDGIQRRGLILSYLLRFKQICNHPCQWLGHGDYIPEASGKFLRLQELCSAIHAKQEKVLVFTQFREIIPALEAYLSTIFQKKGLVLHGSINIKERAKLVNAFQDDLGPPFFILSLKAGGTGLNLTNASHVIHFDRWWNPAVENQATDRAYRIGQKKNVLVHKFICSGTIEEKIDALINSKKNLAQEVLSSGSEILLTELSNEELLNIVTLDIHRAMGENN